MERRNSSLSFSLSPAVLALSFLPLSQSDNQMTERVLVVVVVGLAHSPDPPTLSILYTPRFYINRSWEGGGDVGASCRYSHSRCLFLSSLFPCHGSAYHPTCSTTVSAQNRLLASLSLSLSLSCFAFSYSMFNFFSWRSERSSHQLR
jgi:hypothetical protein